MKRRPGNKKNLCRALMAIVPAPPPCAASCSLPVPQTAAGEPEVDESMREAVAEVSLLLGYCFRSPKLVEEALTHSSFPGAASYQRLEYVGDAALGLAFTNYFFLTNPGLGPGDLSSLRAANVSTEKLARVAVRRGLHRLLRHSSPVLAFAVAEFAEAVSSELDGASGGAVYGGSSLKAPKVLADIVESVAAAVYVDCNFNLETLWKVFRGILEPIITADTLDQQPVATLYERCQKQGRAIDFRSWRKGDTNITNVFVDGELLGIGSSEHKDIAKLNAARSALEALSSSELILAEVEQAVMRGSGDEAGAKQRLHEFCMKRKYQKPIYKIESEHGPSHNKRYVCSVQVEVEGKSVLILSDMKSRVKDAENAAAFTVLSEIQQDEH